METDGLKLLFLLLISSPLTCLGVESFRVTINDRSVKLEAPLKVTKTFSVIVENKSLSDVVGKFHSHGEDLKFVSVKANAAKSVEFSHQSKHLVYFKILSPAFQDLALEVGKKTYEVPSVQ
jgi:hypothetical protein